MPAFCKQNLKCAQARCQLSEAESGIVGHVHGEHSGDHNHQDFAKVLRCELAGVNGRRTAIQMGGVLTIFPFPPSVGAPKETATQIGGVLQYKLDLHCDTFLRSTGGWGSDILLSCLRSEKMGRCSVIKLIRLGKLWCNKGCGVIEN